MCNHGVSVVPRAPFAIATLDFVALSGSLHAVQCIKGEDRFRVHGNETTKEIRFI